VNDLLLEIFAGPFFVRKLVSCFCFVSKKCAGHPKVEGFVAPKTGENGFRSHCLKKTFLAGTKNRNKVHYMQLGGKVMDALIKKFAWDSTKHNGVPKNASQKWKSVPSHSLFSRNDSGKFPSCLKREKNNLNGGATTGSRCGIHSNLANPELREHSPSNLSPVT